MKKTKGHMNIGERIKKYEHCSASTLLPRGYIVIRVDGRAFHTFTKDLEKPFDINLVEAMVQTGERCSKEMQGFKLGYQQSDEFTFILSDLDSYETEMWFDRDVQKICSITAGMFTAYFNDIFGSKNAMFDARVFNVPAEDIPNVIIWRQRDWERNSIQMLARSVFSHKELHNKKRSDIHEMLFTKNINWSRLADNLKNGTLIFKDGTRISQTFTYDNLKSIIKNIQLS